MIIVDDVLFLQIQYSLSISFITSFYQIYPRLGFCPTITENELSLMPYFTRVKGVDRVGVEPTTSAMLIAFK
jgi:hypothetical protein